jgi:hypothetical protein
VNSITILSIILRILPASWRSSPDGVIRTRHSIGTGISLDLGMLFDEPSLTLRIRDARDHNSGGLEED